MKSIKFRLVSTYVIIIMLTMLLIEFGVYSLINQYYMANIRTVLESQQDICVDLYDQFYYHHDIREDSEMIGEKLTAYTDAQLQLVGIDGEVLFDSVNRDMKGRYITIVDFNLADDNDMATSRGDLDMAQENEIGTWRGDLESGEPVYAITQKLKVEGEGIAYIRFVTSLETTYDVINQLMMIMLFIGIIIVVIVSLVSVGMANTIVRPVLKLADYARSIAGGTLDQRLEIIYDDELGDLTEALNFMANELAKSEKTKDQFISSISHELRTPLTSIEGWAFTLKTTEGYDELLFNEGLGILEDEARRLASLVNDLLDYSNLSKESLSIEKEDINMYELAIYVYKQMMPRAHRKGIDFRFNWGSIPKVDRSMIFRGDYHRLKQALINLLDNAIKYSDQESIVAFNYVFDDEMVGFQVIDSGKGIHQDDLPNVFNKYFQGRNSVDGTGLGLALVKEIVERHGGQIQIDSKIDQGTFVTINFKNEQVVS